MNKTYCPVPFYSVELNPNNFKLCCVSSKQYNYPNHNFLDFWKADTLDAIRKKNLDNIPIADCTMCYNRDKKIGQSKRLNEITTNKFYKEATEFPTHLQIKLSNICNLKCIMCSPDYSTKWNEDVQSFSLMRNLQKSKTNYFKKEEIEAILTKFIKTNPTSNKTLELYGGEPMLAKKFWSYLDNFDADCLKNVNLQLVSNGTFIKDYHLNNMIKFKSVNFVISVDGIDEVFEFVRFPAKWCIVDRNIKKINDFAALQRNKFKFTLNFTLSSFSAIGLKHFLIYCKKYNYPYCINVATHESSTSKGYSNPGILQEHLKLLILNDIKNIIEARWFPIVKNALADENSLEMKQKIFDYYNLIKQHRKQDFISLVGNLYGIDYVKPCNHY